MITYAKIELKPVLTQDVVSNVLVEKCSFILLQNLTSFVWPHLGLSTGVIICKRKTNKRTTFETALCQNMRAVDKQGKDSNSCLGIISCCKSTQLTITI